ncbi:MAG: hypothetical protein HY756_04940 [Nitrospirae bacterium]|nr:hypothetical protein [Nitrospirota bacterium]
MTKLIIETDNNWTREKIKSAIHIEVDILRKTIHNIQEKLNNFENKYGQFNRESLYGKITDMELIEWEGEIETLERLQKRLTSLKEIIFEYK